jgi:hypothetical protein
MGTNPAKSQRARGFSVYRRGQMILLKNRIRRLPIDKDLSVRYYGNDIMTTLP